MAKATNFGTGAWPALSYEDGRDTLETLHLWIQIVGKVRLAQSPWLNHSWHATLYVTDRGLTTSPIPHGQRSFQIDFDFVDHDGLGLPADIHGTPNELPEPIPFADDDTHASYDPDYASRFWRAMAQSHRVMSWFRAGFLGKSSPVHLFWGSLDLAVTRFSGRKAPLHPGGIPNLPDRVTREAYSHEVSSAGFWAGNFMVPYAAFYSYAYPTPDGFSEADIEPGEATWNEELGEFLLPYEAVRSASDPDAVLKRFLETTYEAAAELGDWDRERLETSRSAPTDEEWGLAD